MPTTRRKIRLVPNGPEKEAELIEIQQASEHWNQYLLSDQTVIKVKLVATEVWRVDDEWDPEGNPVYLVKSSNVITINATEELRRKQ